MLPTGFHVSGGTLDTARQLDLFVYGILTLFDVPSHVLRLDLIDTKCSPNPKVIADSGLASSAFARHY